MSEAPSVFVAGLGLMGRPIASTLAAGGLPVRGWNRTQLEPGLVDGVEVTPELAEAGGADVVLLVLLDTDAVAAVLARLEPSLRPGQVVVDVTTSWPPDSVVRAARLAERGVGWVDAPVSGGPPGVLARELAVLAGGEGAHVERVRPVLEQLGRVTHVGGPGSGHAVKLVNQTITALYVEAVAEGLALAERAGLDLGVVREALAGSAADSRIFRIQGARMAAREFAPSARATVLLKDLELISRLAAELELDLPHVASTRALYEELVARGCGDLDVSALYTLRD